MKIEDVWEEEMVRELLAHDILFVNSRKYLGLNDQVESETLVLFVNCNDTFAWGCADAENITLKELPELYKLHIENPKCGATQWVCLKRNEKPQKPVIKYLKENGGWNDDMENLPYNRYDKLMEEKYGKEIQK